MKIKIEDTEVEVFSGARVKDALLKYSKPMERAVREGEKVISDRWGNTMAMEGALSENQQLFIQHIKNPDPRNQDIQNNGGSL